jgi:antirestriction protein ArdC
MTGPTAVTDGADRLTAIHDRLSAAVEELASSQAWQVMLSVAARFHTYSPNNVMLIAAQRPDATRVAGYRAWTRLGRQVRKGEHGIAILAPVLRRPATDADQVDRGDPSSLVREVRGFRGIHVFDISQTDGPALPEVRPSLLDGAAPLSLWADLLDQVEADGYRFGYADLAPANGRTDFSERSVTLDRDLPGAQQVKTLAHELAHVRLHAPDVRPAGCDRSRAEVEAESVAYVVTAAHGVPADGYTVPYVAGWAGGNHELIVSTAARVVSCARVILRHAEPASVDTAAAGPVIEPDRPPAMTRPGWEPTEPTRVMQR